MTSESDRLSEVMYSSCVSSREFWKLSKSPARFLVTLIDT